MYPNAEVPVYQLSLPQQASLADHVQGAEAKSVRVGSRKHSAHWVDRLPGLT